MAGTLTKKQKAFCEFYADCRNATEAAVAAGYGKDRKSAATLGSRLTKDPAVLAYINELDRQLYEAIGISPELIAVRMEKIYQRSERSERDGQALKVLKEMRGILQNGQKSGGMDLNITLNIINPEAKNNGPET